MLRGTSKKQTRELLCESLKKLKSAKKLSSIFGNEIALSARLAAAQAAGGKLRRLIC